MAEKKARYFSDFSITGDSFEERSATTDVAAAIGRLSVAYSGLNRVIDRSLLRLAEGGGRSMPGKYAPIEEKIHELTKSVSESSTRTRFNFGDEDAKEAKRQMIQMLTTAVRVFRSAMECDLGKSILLNSAPLAAYLMDVADYLAYAHEAVFEVFMVSDAVH